MRGCIDGNDPGRVGWLFPGNVSRARARRAQTQTGVNRHQPCGSGPSPDRVWRRAARPAPPRTPRRPPHKSSDQQGCLAPRVMRLHQAGCDMLPHGTPRSSPRGRSNIRDGLRRREDQAPTRALLPSNFRAATMKAGRTTLVAAGGDDGRDNPHSAGRPPHHDEACREVYAMNERHCSTAYRYNLP